MWCVRLAVHAAPCRSIQKPTLTGLSRPAREQKGLPLGAVNLLVLPVVVGCTSLVTALGVTALAAHTIIKQVWDFWTQVSQCLNIAANSMVASALGEVRRPPDPVVLSADRQWHLTCVAVQSSSGKDPPAPRGHRSRTLQCGARCVWCAVSQRDLSTARDVLLRILLMGFAPGVVLGAVFLVAQSAIPAVFTQDPGVISAVTHIVPLLALAMVRVLCMMDRLTMPVLHVCVCTWACT